MRKSQTLHITNGESVALKETGLPGEVVYWNDVLHEGPVPAGLTLNEMSVVRARFLAGFGDEGESDIPRQLAERDRTLENSLACQEVVLWFEHDLFDQLQLIQILNWFGRQSLGRTKLSLISIDRYLGLLEPAELAALYPTRRPVTAGQLQLASRAWRDFCSPAPTALAQLIREDTSVLPFLRGSLLRHLEQFPWVTDGLSRTERQILENAASGVSKVPDLFRADQQKEERIFMGDLIFFGYVRGLVRAKVPLLRLVNGGSGFRDAEVELTREGKAVLRGNADHVRLNGIDRWLGGVHLHGTDVWRWNENRSSPVLDV